jgi:hypothetical protein
MPSKSYLTKTFVVNDKDARIRNAKDLAQLVTYEAGDVIPTGKKVGDPKTIPNGSKIKVTDVKISNGMVFARAVSATDPSGLFGWTSTHNLAGQFINETLGEIKPQDDDKKGSNAAWERGKFLGQVTLVSIVDVTREVERVTLGNLDAYQQLVADAAKDGVGIMLRSGFRTFGEQKFLHDGFIAKKKGFNLAAKPGFSNHQHGQAFDIAVSAYDGDPIYDWLKVKGPKLGFIRTVNKEPWHWELRPAEAAKLAAKGLHKAAGVKK